jgi:nitric oxide reductase activation protein
VTAQPDGSPAHVHLSDVQRLLSLFAQGLTGRYLQLRPIENQEEAADGTATAPGRIAASPSGERTIRPRPPTTDGRSIHLPELVEVFPVARHNLGFYRIAILHQIGLFERGTYTFSLGQACARIPALREAHGETSVTPDCPPDARRGEEGPAPPAQSMRPKQPIAATPPDAPDLERFFGLWPAPSLMRNLFMTLEDLRIDRGIRRDYPGARDDLDRVLAQALASRPPIADLPLFARLLEGLTRHTLGATPAELIEEAARVGEPLETSMRALLDIAATIDRDDADVIDTAAAAIRCYRVIAALGLPRRTLPRWSRPGAQRASGTGPNPPDGDADDETDDPDAPVDEDAIGGFPVPFRGDVQPQLVQRQLRAGGIVGELDAMMAADGTGDSEAPDPSRREALERTLRADQSALRRAFGRADDGARSYLYDEWDFHRQAWLKGWCRLFERRLEGKDRDFLDKVHERHGALAHRIRQQFRQLKPESHERIRRVSDGDELELDGIIEAVIDRRSGHATDERLYVRRQKARRDVAAAFLLDMSASTDFQIPDPNAPALPDAPEPEESDEDIPYLWNLPARLAPEEVETPRRRVIDIARESLALMSEALETLGDRHALYGFSGYGRNEVDFYVAKAFEDRVSARTWAAMSAMEPKRSTRMGPAIRHALARLALQEARMKVLMIVSDGFPEDTDYGPDRNDREYGIQDTAMALREAERTGVDAFCITVDRAGHDYLRRMCAPDRYLVIEEVADLPEALGKVYRALTA